MLPTPVPLITSPRVSLIAALQHARRHWAHTRKVKHTVAPALDYAARIPPIPSHPFPLPCLCVRTPLRRDLHRSFITLRANNPIRKFSLARREDASFLDDSRLVGNPQQAHHDGCK